jgi:hypothetical protein
MTHPRLTIAAIAALLLWFVGMCTAQHIESCGGVVVIDWDRILLLLLYAVYAAGSVWALVAIWHGLANIPDAWRYSATAENNRRIRDGEKLD